MARALGLFPAALIAARGNMGANAFYNELRTLGVAPRRSEALALYRTAKGVVSVEGNDVYEDPNANPASGVLRDWPTKNATGIRQNVTLVYRDRATGEFSTTKYSVVSDNGITRNEAVNEAVAAYSDQAENYDQDLISAVHTSAFQFAPFGF